MKGSFMALPRTFSVAATTRTVEDFERIAELVGPLKKHGRVEMGISSLAEKTWSDIPPGGSAWHEYTSHLSSLEKFFPHPKMAPFMDAGHVKKNRALLQGKVKVLKRLGYGAAFSAHAPWFLPEGFFAKYPQYRGPRCDHPRRSRREAFSMCPDLPETQQMYTEMMQELAREVPDLWWLSVGTNDAGAGLCWADWIYPGPNGPRHCRHIPTDARVRSLMEAFHKGMGDRPLDISINGNFSESEQAALTRLEQDDEYFHYRIHHGRNDPHQVNIGSLHDNPVKGIFDAVDIVKTLDRLRNPTITRIGVGFGLNYARGRDNDDVIQMVIELADAYLAEPAHGSVERLVFLRKMCGKWVGEKRRDELLEAFVSLHEALVHKHIAAPRFTTNYCGVSMRHITRPLVIVPERLTAEEESYFLPHVFNIHEAEARTDYIDWHGGKLQAGSVREASVHSDPRIGAVDRFCETLVKVAGTMSEMGDSGAGQFFRRMGVSLRLYASVMRSVNNFFAAGTVRDRNVGKLTGAGQIPPKLGDWVGDPDLQILNATMRDELDNAAEMVGLLESGGMEQMLTAATREEEDTFLLGPDLLVHMRKKISIMRKHWIDAQSYMATPHK